MNYDIGVKLDQIIYLLQQMNERLEELLTEQEEGEDTTTKPNGFEPSSRKTKPIATRKEEEN